MAADRILNMKVSATSNWIAPNNLGAHLVWQQTGQTGLGNSNRVDPAGNINLQRMPRDSQWSDSVRIQITLDDHMTDFNGRPVHARYARPGEGPIEPGYCWFMARCGDSQPTTPANVSSSRVSDNLVRIQDNRTSQLLGGPLPTDDVPYAWALGMIVELPVGPYFITLDPVTGGKGTGTTPIDGEDEADCASE